MQARLTENSQRLFLDKAYTTLVQIIGYTSSIYLGDNVGVEGVEPTSPLDFFSWAPLTTTSSLIDVFSLSDDGEAQMELFCPSAAGLTSDVEVERSSLLPLPLTNSVEEASARGVRSTPMIRPRTSSPYFEGAIFHVTISSFWFRGHDGG